MTAPSDARGGGAGDDAAARGPNEAGTTGKAGAAGSPGAVPGPGGAGRAGGGVEIQAGRRVRRGPVGWLWFAAGWLAVGLGTVGVIVPGLPTTVFFIVAAACFARCSPRFEQWVLDLPRVGNMVRDHRAGLGMRRRAKVAAVTTIVGVSTLSAVVAIGNPVVGLVVVAVGLVGAAYVLFRVPTRERVVAGDLPSTSPGRAV